MRTDSDSVKKVLAVDQIAEGLVFDKRPSNQELILGHILLRHEEGRTVVPRELIKIIGCSPESLRLMLRKAEKGGFVVTTGRPDYEIRPSQKLLWLVFQVSQEWRVRNQRRLLPYSPTIRDVYRITQSFDIYTRVNNLMPFVLKSPMKRGITFFVLDRGKFGGVELTQLRHNFPIDHESLRQFINSMIETRQFEKYRKGKKAYIRPTRALTQQLNTIVDEVCAGLASHKSTFTVYSDFIDNVLSDKAVRHVAE